MSCFTSLQILTSVSASHVGMGPVKTQWDPTTVSATLALSLPLTMTAWVSFLYLYPAQHRDNIQIMLQRQIPSLF